MENKTSGQNQSISNDNTVRQSGKIPKGNTCVGITGSEPNKCPINFKVSKSLKERIEDEAKLRNLTVSEYLRQTVSNPDNRTIVIEKGGDILSLLSNVYNLQLDIKELLSGKTPNIDVIKAELTEVNSKFDGVSKTFEELAGKITFMFNCINSIKENLIAENESCEDTIVYEEDSIEDGLFEEGADE